MRYIISGKNLDITEGLRSAVTDKLGKLERYFTPDTEVHVTLSVEKERQKIEVTIPVKGNIIRSEQSSTDMYVSIDLVEEVIERQLRKYKNKLVARQQGGGNFQNGRLTIDLSQFRTQLDGPVYAYRYLYGRLYRVPAIHDAEANTITLSVTNLGRYVLTGEKFPEATPVD